MPFDAAALSASDRAALRPGSPNPESGCRVAPGNISATGEVRLWLPDAKREVAAHRLAWSLANGPIPDGARLLHRCPGAAATSPAPSRACCNPDHLELVTA